MDSRMTPCYSFVSIFSQSCKGTRTAIGSRRSMFDKGYAMGEARGRDTVGERMLVRTVCYEGRKKVE